MAALRAIENDAGMRYASVEATRFCAELSDRGEAEHTRAREQGLALVLEADNRPIGFILVLPIDGRAHILELAVARDQQGCGHGRTLMAAAEQWASAQGFREMTLTTFRDIIWNAPFYTRLGFDIFNPAADRPELGAMIADEIRAGVHRAARVAMRKILQVGLSAGHVIRQERPSEFPHIRRLIKDAFTGVPHAEGDEQDFVDRLRGTESYLPELALGLEEDGCLIGHIMLTRLSIDMSTGPYPILLLACVAVMANRRNHGLGSALIEAVFERARHDGHGAVILVGDPAFYTRFGFQPSSHFGIVNVNGIEPEYVQICELTPGALGDVAGSVDLPS